MTWPLLIGSLAAILGLAYAARVLRLGESAIDSPEAAAAHAEAMLAGFRARDVLISKDGSAALVAGNGAIAVLKRHGAKVAARRLISPIKHWPSPEGVAIDTGERMFGKVVLFGVLEEDVARLEAQLTSA